MNVYASTVINGQEGWGDGFPALFICESMELKNPSWKFFIHDGPCMGTGHKDASFRHRDYIEKPWFVEEFVEIPDSKDFDAVIATHTSHPFKPSPMAIKQDEMGGYLPPMNYTTPINILRVHSDRAMLDLKLQGFKASVRVKNPPELPEKYVAIQFRRNDTFKSPTRNVFNGDEHDVWAREFLEAIDLPVVSVSDYVGGLDMSHLNLWQKIHVAQHSEQLYASHSGFGMVMAMHAKKAKVINCSGTQRNPSIGVFDNVKSDLFHQQPGPYVSARYTLRPV